MTLQQLKYAIAVADNGSMNEAAKKLFISQPSLSGMIKELEEEVDMQIFLRSNRGILITPGGEEFLGYARQVVEQYRLMEDRFVEKKVKKKFSVSAQHYTFAVKAFVELVKQVGMDEYEFAIYETKTYDIIQAVKNFLFSFSTFSFCPNKNSVVGSPRRKKVCYREYIHSPLGDGDMLSDYKGELID
ncbi:MAG: LysR family transcriptional regulator [Ligilactobacillus ruminis]|nr:LysR family transcriptional regulator [Ligilactobacillus ruminis]